MLVRTFRFATIRSMTARSESVRMREEPVVEQLERTPFVRDGFGGLSGATQDNRKGLDLPAPAHRDLLLVRP